VKMSRWMAENKRQKSFEKFDSVPYTVMKDGGRTIRLKLNVITIRRDIGTDPLIVNRIAKTIYVWQKRKHTQYHIFIRNVAALTSHRGGYMVEFDLYDSFMRFEQVAVFDCDFCLARTFDVGELLRDPDVGYGTTINEDRYTTTTIGLFVHKRVNAAANRTYHQ
jgi:hypothetical protein